MKTRFYAVKSLANVFLAGVFDPQTNVCDLFHHCDSDVLVQNSMFEVNVANAMTQADPGFYGQMVLHDLKTEAGMDAFKQCFGFWNSSEDPYRLIHDTDLQWSESLHGWFLGFHSKKMDLPLLCIYMEKVGSMDLSAQMVYRTMQEDLENGRILLKSSARKELEKRRASGRFLDMARLNEKKKEVPLNRMLGQMGYALPSCPRLVRDLVRQEADLISQLTWMTSRLYQQSLLFEEPVYSQNLKIKASLFSLYPQLLYRKGFDDPQQQKKAVRPDRLFADSSSASLISMILAPYEPVRDLPAVSYAYPSAQRAAELNITQMDVLETARSFFDSHFQNTPARGLFAPLYRSLKKLEKQNLNTSTAYRHHYLNSRTPTGLEPSHLRREKFCLPLLDRSGQPAGSYVSFSNGGLQGGAYNQERYLSDQQQAEKLNTLIAWLRQRNIPPAAIRRKGFVTVNGTRVPASDLLENVYEPKDRDLCFKTPASLAPRLFLSDKNGQYLNPRYEMEVYEPQVFHNDFTSFYPSLLTNLSAFYRPEVQEDPYRQLYEKKSELTRQMVHCTSPQEKERLETQRSAVKLLLNAASGAADTTRNLNIQMNNRMTSVRIMGQLLVWMLCQSLALQGSRTVSVHTDGFYNGNIRSDRNDQIMQQYARRTGLVLETEPVTLSLRNANTRLELKSNRLTAAAGSLFCAALGIRADQSLDHPALLDVLMARYYAIRPTPAQSREAFVSRIDKELEALRSTMPARDFLQYCQMVLASSESSFFYGVDKQGREVLLDPVIRILPVKDLESSLTLKEGMAIAVSEKIRRQRSSREERELQHDLAVKKLADSMQLYASEHHEWKSRKIRRVNPKSRWIILQENLHQMAEEKARSLADHVDLEVIQSMFLDAVRDDQKTHVL